MWKGAISFGLVTIPVAVYPATEEKTLRFNQLHDEDGGRIRQKRVCEKDGEEVTYEHIVKGYEVEKDRYVVLTDDDFDAVPVKSSRAIDIVQFVEFDQIDPVLFKKSYYLIPEETGAKAYALLREAMRQDDRVGIAKVSFRDKEHLAALQGRCLRARDDVLAR
jgi:DNA end-binding protein Ku